MRLSDTQELGNFLAAFFHQDWDLDYDDDPEKVVDSYIKLSDSQQLSVFLNEIDAWLSMAKASRPDLIRASGYSFTADGYTSESWLKYLKTRVIESGKLGTSE